MSYAVIAAAIAYLQDHADERPDLAAVAAHVGFSPAHLQRVFSAWAGVSPKNYLQYLTLEKARALLSSGRPTLEASLDAGLSSQSRLHDLILKWEAMTPGEYAEGGAGLDIRWGWFAGGPFGDALLMAAPRGLCGLAFSAEMGREAAFEDMIRRWPRARMIHDPAALAPMADALFGGRGEIALAPMGGPFKIKVWEALMRIPPGSISDYGSLAAAIGSPKAARAVGAAVGRNPVSWLIPCHRVLRKDGALGGYHWGLPLKRALLAYESARASGRAAAPEA